MAKKQISTHAVQAQVEGVPEPEVVGGREKVDFLGSSYFMAERIGLMPLLKFAHVASSGLDSSDMEGLAAMYAMIRDCIDPDDYPRFERDAIDKKADDADLLAVIQKVIQAVSARPTKPPGDSSSGRRGTSRNSKGSSSSRATRPGDEGLVTVDSLLDR